MREGVWTQPDGVPGALTPVATLAGASRLIDGFHLTKRTGLMTSGMFESPETAPRGPTGAIPAPGTASGSNGGGQSTTETAKEQAHDVAREGIEGGKHVASVAADQAKEVASEAGQQAKALLEQARSELIDHAASQQNRVADQLHALAQELGSMASKSEQEGLATELAQQASRRVGSVAHWLSEREPGSLVGELKGYARNKPGMFLAMAAGMGLVAGRMTRGVKAGAPRQDTPGVIPASNQMTTPPPWQGTAPPSGQSVSTAAAPWPTGPVDDDAPRLVAPTPVAGAGAGLNPGYGGDEPLPGRATGTTP